MTSPSVTVLGFDVALIEFARREQYGLTEGVGNRQRKPTDHALATTPYGVCLVRQHVLRAAFHLGLIHKVHALGIHALGCLGIGRKWLAELGNHVRDQELNMRSQAASRLSVQEDTRANGLGTLGFCGLGDWQRVIAAVTRALATPRILFRNDFLAIPALERFRPRLPRFQCRNVAFFILGGLGAAYDGRMRYSEVELGRLVACTVARAIEVAEINRVAVFGYKARRVVNSLQSSTGLTRAAMSVSGLGHYRALHLLRSVARRARYAVSSRSFMLRSPSVAIEQEYTDVSVSFLVMGHTFAS